MSGSLNVPSLFVQECKNEHVSLLRLPSETIVEAIEIVLSSTPDSKEKSALLATWEDEGDLTRAKTLLGITGPIERPKSGVSSPDEQVKEGLLGLEFDIRKDVEMLLMPAKR